MNVFFSIKIPQATIVALTRAPAKSANCPQYQFVDVAECSSTLWWFQIFFYFHSHLGKIPILTNIFQMD